MIRGLVTVHVPPRFLAWAHDFRARRDQQYRANIFEPPDGDWRWVGDLGECVFAWWLRRMGIAYTWIREDAAGQPDFLVHGQRIGLKTSRRQVPFRADYRAIAPARHVEREPSDQFFFCSYEVPRETMWLLGGCAHATFGAYGRRYEVGEYMHPACRVVSPMYALPADALLTPRRWLAALAQPQAVA